MFEEKIVTHKILPTQKKIILIRRLSKIYEYICGLEKNSKLILGFFELFNFIITLNFSKYLKTSIKIHVFTRKLVPLFNYGIIQKIWYVYPNPVCNGI